MKVVLLRKGQMFALVSDSALPFILSNCKVTMGDVVSDPTKEGHQEVGL